MEILNTTTEITWSAWFIGFPGVFGTMFAFGFALYYLIDAKIKKALVSCLILALCVFSFIFAYKPYYNSPAGHHVYHQVLLKDGEKIDESKYKFVRMEGKITVIEELHPEPLNEN